jgi:RND family efflux transporter MFP subunit
VRAVDELPLSFAFGGVVKSLRVEAGEHVHKGQILAVLDAAAATAQLEQAESALSKAERDADRAARLAEASAVADATLKDARTGVSVARAQRDAAAFQARRSVLVAPADGVVLDRFVEPEQTVAPGTPILSIASQGGFELLVDVAAADAQALLPGAAASVVVDAVSSEPVGGHVLRKAGGAGPLGTWRVTVALDPHEGLASGLLGVATLTPTASARPSIPVGALAEADGSSGAVYTVDAEGKARRVPVKVAFLAGDRVALADDGGATQVIDQGVAFVRDGAAVRVR